MKRCVSTMLTVNSFKHDLYISNNGLFTSLLSDNLDISLSNASLIET